MLWTSLLLVVVVIVVVVVVVVVVINESSDLFYHTFPWIHKLIITKKLERTLLSLTSNHLCWKLWPIYFNIKKKNHK